MTEAIRIDAAMATLENMVKRLGEKVEGLAGRCERMERTLRALGLDVDGLDVDPLEAYHLENRARLAARKAKGA